MPGHFLDDCLQAPESDWSLADASTGLVIAPTLLTAFDRERRNRGLLGRDHLPPGEALVLAPCSSIHTFFMRFALDVLFVGRDGCVLKVRRNLPPWRLAIRPGALAVVEFAAGGAANIEPGHRLAVVRRGAAPAAAI